MQIALYVRHYYFDELLHYPKFLKHYLRILFLAFHFDLILLSVKFVLRSGFLLSSSLWCSWFKVYNSYDENYLPRLKIFVLFVYIHEFHYRYCCLLNSILVSVNENFCFSCLTVKRCSREAGWEVKNNLLILTRLDRKVLWASRFTIINRAWY